MKEATARLGCLFAPLEQLESFTALRDAVRGDKLCALYGPDESQRAHMLAALAQSTGRSMIVLAPNDMLAMRMAEDMNVLLDGGARYLPARDVSFVKSSASSRDLSMRRNDVIGACATGQARVLVASADAAMTSSWQSVRREMPAAKLETRESPAILSPHAFAKTASGTVDMPTISAPCAL